MVNVWHSDPLPPRTLGGPADVLVALHACDTATDDAIYSGIRANASVIIVRPFPGYYTSSYAPSLDMMHCVSPFSGQYASLRAPLLDSMHHCKPLSWTWKGCIMSRGGAYNVDTATDDAIYSGIRANASVIIVRTFPGHHAPLTWTVCAPFFHRERHFGPLEWTGGVVVGPICGHCTALPHTACYKGTSEIDYKGTSETPNPRPQTPNPRPQTPDPKPQPQPPIPTPKP